MTTIPRDLWEWFERALDDNSGDPASVNPDKLLAWLETRGLRITVDTAPAPDDTAFDGQHEEPRRALTARERDILCRMISDARTTLRHGDGWFGRTNVREEWPALESIYHAIDPRGSD